MTEIMAGIAHQPPPFNHIVANGSNSHNAAQLPGQHGLHGHATGLKPVTKYKLGISALAFVQIVGGLMTLCFEAMGSVVTNIYRGSMEEVTYAGMYVGIFAMITGIIGALSSRKHFSAGARRFLFITSSVFTIFLSLQAFAMSCASAATLVFTTTSWDTLLEFVNRVSKSVDLNLSLGTTTTTATSSLPPNIQLEIAQDRLLMAGLRSSLFAIYFILFASAVISSCFGCCNYCKCWTQNQQDHHHEHHHEHHLHPHSHHHVSLHAHGPTHGALHGNAQAAAPAVGGKKDHSKREGRSRDPKPKKPAPNDGVEGSKGP